MPLSIHFSSPNPMGEVHADLTLTNLFSRQTARVRALVDTGATHMFVTEEIARALGFDSEEVRHTSIVLADGRRLDVPCIGPLEIQFEDRKMRFEAFVLGDECLMGQIPLEGMDLIVDPRRQRLIGKHPEGPLFRV